MLAQIDLAYPAADRHAGDRPWEAGPYRLWSLLDMLRPWAHRFGELLSCISDCEQALAKRDPASQIESAYQYYIRHILNSAHDYAKEIGLDPGGQIERLLGSLDPSMQERIKGFPVPTADDMRGRLRTLRESLDRELKARSFLYVPNDRAAWYHDDDKPLFGDAVATVFPDSTREIAEFGRCFALGQWTASVFHLMRVTELALQKWCDEVGFPLKTPAEQANMQDIINAAMTHQKHIAQQPRSPQRDEELAYFGANIASFTGIKDAWRNHVAHAKSSYDERAARSILEHVRAFMERLSSRS